MATITSALAVPTGRNLLADPRLTATIMGLEGATVVDTRPSSGGPDGGSFFRRTMTTANTSSPMIMPLAATGLGGIPVTAGQTYTSSWYAAKSAGGPQARTSVNWYNAAGASISTTTGTNMSPGTSWARFTEALVAPALAAFARPNLAWSGTALVAQTLDFAMAQFEVGSTASPWTDNRTLHPLLVLNYATRRASRNVLLEPLGSKYPTTFLREAQSKAGTLSLLFQGDAEAREAEDFLGAATRFTFSEPTVGELWDFVVTGAITRTQQATSVWIVDAEVREVEAL